MIQKLQLPYLTGETDFFHKFLTIFMKIVSLFFMKFTVERKLMTNSIDQQVIDFTAAYTGSSPGAINNSTTLDSLGIVTKQDIVDYVTELEDSFDLMYEEGDANGIATVGDAAALIERKLGENG